MKANHPFPSPAVINLAQKCLSPTSIVLDVGCHTGLTGKTLKKLSGGQVWGIDISEKAIKKAKKVLDKTILTDINSPDLDLPKNFFDLIIMSNILEHLPNPSAILIKFKKFLKKRGLFLIAVPNIAFWSIRLGLLVGKFEYQDFGVLDKGHLRFFTLSSSRKLVQEAGLEIKEETTNYVGWRAKIAQLWPTLLASQFVILCKKNSRL